MAPEYGVVPINPENKPIAVSFELKVRKLICLCHAQNAENQLRERD